MECALVNTGPVDHVPVSFATDHYNTSLQQQETHPQVMKKPSKRPRNGSTSGTDVNRREYYEWSHGAVHSLLDIYEEKYSALQRGNLRGRHWHEVAQHVSSREEGSKSVKTSKQCKMKIENLKRRYKMEKTHRMSNPAFPSPTTTRWPYYDRLDGMLGFTPKAAALTNSQQNCTDTLSGSEPLSSQDPNPKSKEEEEEEEEGGAFTEPAVECEGESEMPAAPAAGAAAENCEPDDPDVGDGDGDQEEGGGGRGGGPVGNRKDSKTDASEVNTMLNGPGGGSGGEKMRGQVAVRSEVANPTVFLANSITAFAEILSRIEQAKMEMHKDLERQRTEADLKRTQMVLDNQLQIAKLILKGQKRKGRSKSSSSESD